MEIGKSLLETLKQISTALSTADVEHCLIGGLALAMVARPRTTEDIDILVLLNEEQIGKLSAIIHEGFQVIHAHKEVMTFGKSKIWRVLLSDPFSGEGSVLLDILFAEHVIHQNAVRNALTVTVDSIPISVVKPEDLILLKMLSGRDQDLLDIELIREENQNNLDEGYIKIWKERI